MFENPRRGRQARNFTTNVPNRYFLKIHVGCPCKMRVLCTKHFMIIKHEEGQEETLCKSPKELRREGPTIWESCASRFSPFQCFFKSWFLRLWAVSYFSLQSYCTWKPSMQAAINKKITLADIRTRHILREKTDCKQSIFFSHNL